jgi:hypothetical protein
MSLKYLLIVPILALLLTGCQTKHCATGDAMADASLVPQLATLQFEYATDQRQPVDDYTPGIKHDTQGAYTAVLLDITEKFLGEDEAILLGRHVDVPAHSAYHLTPNTAKLLTTEHKYLANHVIRCTSVMEAEIQELNRVYTFTYSFHISLCSALYPTPWDAQLHADKGFTHQVSHFKALKVKRRK